MLHSILVILEFSVVPLVVPFILFLSKRKKQSRTPIPILYDEFSFELLATDSSLIVAFAIRVFGDNKSYNGKALEILFMTFLIAFVYVFCSIIRALSADKHKIKISSVDANTLLKAEKNFSTFVILALLGHFFFAMYLVFITVVWYDHH